MEKDTVVYKHIKKDTKEVFYIGIGNLKRPYSKDNRNTHWFNTVNKYGYNVEIIQEGLTWDEACEEENRLIKLYGRKDLGLGPLVNLTDGGDGGKNPSEYTREKMRKAKESYRGEGHPQYGIPKSKKQKEKQRKTMTGRKHTDSTKEKVSVVTRGENNAASILTDEDVIFIRKSYFEKPRNEKKNYRFELAKKYGVKERTIRYAIWEGWKPL